VFLMKMKCEITMVQYGSGDPIGSSETVIANIYKGEMLHVNLEEMAKAIRERGFDYMKVHSILIFDEFMGKGNTYHERNRFTRLLNENI